MQENPVEALPPPVRVGATEKKATSAWAIIALIGAILLVVPPVPIICGIVALVKIRRSPGRLGGVAMAVIALVLGCMEVVLVLASLVVPAILRTKREADTVLAMSNMRQLGGVMFEFEQDWGEFPSRKVFEENPDQFPGLEKSDDTGNFYLGMLLAGNYIASYEPFFATHSLPPYNPSGPPVSEVLEAGDCDFSYVMLAGSEPIRRQARRPSSVSDDAGAGFQWSVSPVRSGTVRRQGNLSASRQVGSTGEDQRREAACGRPQPV